MSNPTVNPSPGLLRFHWEPEEVIIEASHFHESSRAMSCELTVTCANPMFEGRDLLYWGTLNLAAPRSRKDLAKELSERWNVNEKGNDKAILAAWDDMILQFVTMVVQHIRQGEPVYDLWSDTPLEPLEYLLYPVIPLGEPAVIFGPGGSGKSFLALAMSACAQLALKNNRLNLKATQDPVNVLYLDYETKYKTMGRRLALVAAGLGLPRFPIKYRRCYRPFSQEVDTLHKIVMQNKIGLVVIDSLGAACGGELKEAEPALAISSALRELGVSSLTIAHPAKGNGEGEKSIYGSVFFQAYGRSIWEIKKYADRGKKDFAIGLNHVKVNDSELFNPLGFEISFGEEAVRIRSKGVSDIIGAEELLSSTQRIKAVLMRFGKMTNKQIEEETGMAAANVRQGTHRLKDAGEIIKIGEAWGLLTVADDQQAGF